MLMVISPAKALDFAAPDRRTPLTMPQLIEDTALLAQTTSKLTARQLKSLMGLSDKLAELNVVRFRAFDARSEEGLQALFAFNGDVYRGLKARELDGAALNWAQEHLRILSGLYGVLRPLDAIQPYRLEMGTTLKTRRGGDLYAFWGERIATELDAAAWRHRDRTLVNLASEEYFAAVDPKALRAPRVTCRFRQERGGKLHSCGFLAKRARGLMVRFAIDHRIDRAEDLRGFDREGYRFLPEVSTERDWVFARPFV